MRCRLVSNSRVGLRSSTAMLSTPKMGLRGTQSTMSIPRPSVVTPKISALKLQNLKGLRDSSAISTTRKLPDKRINTTERRCRSNRQQLKVNQIVKKIDEA